MFQFPDLIFNSPKLSQSFLCDRFVTKLLEDLIFFVADVTNNGQDVLDVVITKPNRERQKLMREQNILAQVSCFMNQVCTFYVLSYSISYALLRIGTYDTSTLILVSVSFKCKSGVCGVFLLRGILRGTVEA